MIHPSLAAADLRRADDVYADARETPALRGPRKKKAGISNLALDGAVARAQLHAMLSARQHWIAQ
jgi:hypothetical protein